MSLTKTVDQDMVAAMKARDAERLSTLRMVKTAFKNSEIAKRAPLSDAEAQAVLVTLVKQRRESIEQFLKGNRPALAAKEEAEIVVIEGYMPKALDEAAIRALVTESVNEMAAAGTRPTPKDMGSVMKAVQGRIQQAGQRAEGKLVSELVKAELAKS